ncbi:hypothetical protein [Rhodoferax sp. PAMC 29310]|uniref:hypothetical protein n=1 Tax=Rhodoferax sp. PAMC 29310 TaxID=2822760 RepID=UPI001B31BB2B|nr:hypothetical protein [Rhodoferax sp. PAMC 29310]
MPTSVPTRRTTLQTPALRYERVQSRRAKASCDPGMSGLPPTDWSRRGFRTILRDMTKITLLL